MTSITALMRAAERRAAREPDMTARIAAVAAPPVVCVFCCHEIGIELPAASHGVCDAHRRSAGDDTLRSVLIDALDAMAAGEEGAA